MSAWRRLLGVDKRVIVERVEYDEDADAVVAHVRPRRPAKRRSGRCGRPSPGYSRGEGRRRWRALDLGEVRSFLEADAPRVSCAEHGPTVAQVPWARHGAGHVRSFDDLAAWLAVHTSNAAEVDRLGRPQPHPLLRRAGLQANLAGILQALLNNLSNGLVESTNTKLRVLTRIAYGFKDPDHLIALAYLDRGGLCPPLPGRT